MRVVIYQRIKVAEKGKPPPSRGACTSHMVGTDEERAAFGYPPLGDRVLTLPFAFYGSHFCPLHKTGSLAPPRGQRPHVEL